VMSATSDTISTVPRLILVGMLSACARAGSVARRRAGAGRARALAARRPADTRRSGAACSY